jgi:hypothetical protein
MNHLFIIIINKKITKKTKTKTKNKITRKKKENFGENGKKVLKYSY